MRGASALEQTLTRDSSAVRVLVVWEHVTPGDRKMPIPTTPVLMRLSDPRVEQFWDPHRMLSGLIAHSLPRDTLSRMAEIDSSGRTVVWDCVAVFRPGVRWDRGFPLPDWAGRPVVDVADSLGRWLVAGEAR